MKKVFDAASGDREVVASQMGPFMIGETRAELVANARKQLERFRRSESPETLLERIRKMGAPCGTIDELKEQLGGLTDAGVQRVYFQLLLPENKAMTELLARTLKRKL